MAVDKAEAWRFGGIWIGMGIRPSFSGQVAMKLRHLNIIPLFNTHSSLRCRNRPIVLQRAAAYRRRALSIRVLWSLHFAVSFNYDLVTACS